MFQYDENVGVFNVSCGQIRVSDPCYEKDSDGGFTVDNVINGQWLAYFDYDRFRDSVACVYAVHDMYRYKASVYNLNDVAQIGVDSGQAGIFDKVYYDINQGGEYDNLETFYGKCCKITLDEVCGIVEEYGVVSSSGYGDGSYSVYVGYDKDGLVYCVYIEFVTEEEEEYEDEY